MPDSDPELTIVVQAFAKAFRRKNPPIKGPLRTLVNLLAPVLLASPDPRIKALGLALQSASLAFLTKRNRGGI